MLTIMET